MSKQSNTKETTNKKTNSACFLGGVMRCFQCGEDITPSNNGISINNGDFYQCDDCHYNEWGYRINGNLLVFK
jgi:hypothetical protein